MKFEFLRDELWSGRVKILGSMPAFWAVYRYFEQYVGILGSTSAFWAACRHFEQYAGIFLEELKKLTDKPTGIIILPAITNKYYSSNFLNILKSWSSVVLFHCTQEIPVSITQPEPVVQTGVSSFFSVFLGNFR